MLRVVSLCESASPMPGTDQIQNVNKISESSQ